MSGFDKLGIKARMVLLTLLPTLAITLLLTAYTISKSIYALNQSLSERGRVIATQLAPASEYGVISGNHKSLDNLIKDTMGRESDISSIQITDNHQLNLASVGKTPIASQKLNQQTSAEINTDQYIIAYAPIYKNAIEIDDYLMDTSVPPSAKVTKQVIGKIYVTLSKASIQATTISMIWKSSLLGLIGFIIISLLAYRLGLSISRPIISMASSIKSLEAGRLDIQLDEKAPKEIKTMQQGFNQMAQHIQFSQENLQSKIHDATHLLRYQAQHDALTGLTNRQEFERRLHLALLAVKADGVQHTFCYMDLDQFKVVNDTCGHNAGDELLKQISTIMNQLVRDEDTFARLGGDEFGLLLLNCNSENAAIIAEKMRAQVENFRFLYNNNIFKVGISIGIVEITNDLHDLGEITSRADAACYAAKDNGRNQIHFYQPQDDDLAQRQVEMQWVSRLTTAIDEDRFCLYCQPILPLQNDSDDIFYEILVRKIDVDGAIILPLAFIPSAERYHLMPKIDKWVIRETCAMYHQLISADTPQNFQLTVNLSGMSLGDKGLLDYIKNQLEKYNVPPQKICFEITETSAITNLTNTLMLINNLKAIGCKFLLDDFGSGMSSFAYLKNLPVDYIKMDGSFIKDITRNEIDFAMAQSVQNIAKAMKIKTIAEFVECVDTMKLLELMGVDYGQGFYLGKPMPIKKVFSDLRQLNLLNQLSV
jgi:diguanylate cyclase (GGDEF)-like protein